jgi:excisionase family DNA binding protein
VEVDMQELLSVTDAARILDRSSDAVRLYERSGRLPAMRTVGGIRLFRREDVEALRRALTRAQERRAR